MPKIQEILIVPHTHHDVGYTHMPDICMEAHERGIHEAMRLCEMDLGSEAPHAFRWTVEVSRPLLQFLRHATDGEIARLQRLVGEGRIAITAGYLHMTQLVGHEDYVRFFMPVREFRRYGLPVSVVQHGDVNGLSWGVVPLMREAGLDCLVMALNPDHGRAPLEQPSAFVWEGQDGSRVLVWLSIHYGLGGFTWGLAEGRIEGALEPVSRLVARAEAREDYPFDFVVVHAAEDNMWPNRGVVAAVREWNERGMQPPMRMATIHTVAERLRVYAGSNGEEGHLPVLRGEWADWWAHGHQSSAYEVGVGRQGQAELRVAETLRSLARFAGSPERVELTYEYLPTANHYRKPVIILDDADWKRRVENAYDKLLLFEEHTWGTFESIASPYSHFSQAHWNASARFGFEAETEARELMREGIERLVAALPPGDGPALVVANPSSTPRSDKVLFRTPEGVRAAFVGDVPPMGARVLAWSEVEAGMLPPNELERGREQGIDIFGQMEPPGKLEATGSDAPPESTRLENSYYLIEVDPETASIVRLYDKELQREWVDASGLTGIGGVVYEEADRQDSHPAVSANRRHFHPEQPGPRFVRTAASGGRVVRVERRPFCTTLVMEASAPYLPYIATHVTIYDSVKMVDVTVRLRKDENFGIEGVYVLFPFALERPQFLLETANAVYRAEEEQLPNSCRDWYSVQHGAGVTSGDGTASVLWATRECPMLQLGGFHTGEWATRLDAPQGHIYSWLMNNLYFTNFKAAQSGQATFSYRFTTSPGAATPEAARAWGEAFALPMPARLAPLRPGTYRWLDVEPDTVSVQVLKQASEDAPEATIIRLKETAGKATPVTLTWHGASPARLSRIDLLETQAGVPIEGDGRTFTLSMGAHKLDTLRLDWST
ncbi:MAG TPA: hypothetical protein VF914_01160 [Chloroflexia bacterium]